MTDNDIPSPTPHPPKQYQPFRKLRALWLALVSGLVLTVMMVLGDMPGDACRLNPQFNLLYIAVSNIVLLSILYIYNFWLNKIMERGVARILLCFLGSLGMAAVFSEISFRIEYATYSHTTNPYYMTLSVNLAVGFIVFLVSQLMANMSAHQQVELENEHLRPENLLNQYLSFQRQASPHFFFNSLNTLDGLIGTDDEGARRYLHQLANTFRYITQDHAEVTLAEEMDFTHSYIYIMQIRYGESLHVTERIDSHFLSLHVPPISIQLLVENAIKHNVISLRHPLHITIETTAERTIRVSNALFRKKDIRTSEGVGLSNLAQRYHLMFKKEIVITDDGETFSVEIPLI